MDTKDPRSLEHSDPEHLHEESDVNVRGIVGFALGLALCIGLSGVVLYWVFQGLRDHFTLTPVHPSPIIGVREPVEPQNSPELFPEPRLQVDYSADLAVVRHQWDEQLHSSGWQDKKAGITHIPIEDAMRLTLERGLPTRPPGQPVEGAQPAGKRTSLVANKDGFKQ
jgi:hypothetical protein